MSSSHPGSWTRPDGSRVGRLSILPPAIGIVLAATAIPVELRHPSIEFVSLNVDVGDILRNVALYLPLGVAFRKRRMFTAVSVAFAISVFIEVLQFAYPPRYPSPVDAFSNVSGAAVGWFLARGVQLRVRWRPDVRVTRRIVVVGAVAAIGLLLTIMSRPGERTDFSNWDPECRLAVGDELTHDRTWNGAIHAFYLFDSPLDGTELGSLTPPDGVESPGTWGTMRTKPIYALMPTESSEVSPGAPLLDPTQTDRVFKSLVAGDSLTLVVWLQTDHLRQYDSARIVTFSKDPYHRNFTLGQEGGRLVFRLRTPATDLNGYEPHTRTPEVLKPARPLRVTATYDGMVSRIYLDGRLVGRENLAATRALGTSLFDYHAPLAAFLAGALIATILLGLCALRSGLLSWLTALAGGAVGGGVLIAAGGLSSLPGFAGWSLLLGVVGGACVALAIDVRPGREQHQLNFA